MFNNKVFLMLVIGSVLLSACFGPAPQGGLPPETQSSQAQPSDSGNTGGQGQASPAQEAETSSESTHSDAPHHSDVDLTRLEVGDGKYSDSPKMGYVYTCGSSFNGRGATGNGNWMNGDGTWDATKKAVVDGSVTWPHSFAISIQGNDRVLTGNDLPDHPTGNYPISSSDDAYSVDRNPNSIKEQSITLAIPANPVAAADPNCVGGELGIMLSGVVLFNSFDAEGRDAAAHEVQDNCDGHPQVSGFYHYHTLSDCLEDTTTGHSALMGYAFDGYGIYGYYDQDGSEIINEDLDECHGHTHTIEWDGQTVEMYHYHATHEFPYVIGCFHGTPAVRALSTGQGGAQGQGGQQPQNGQQPSEQQGGQQQQPGGQSQPTGQQGGGQSQGQQPPQQAINACSGKSQGDSCSFSTPNRTVNGTCNTPPNSSQMACMPAGGPP